MLTQALVVSEPGAEFTYQEIEVEDQLRDDEVLVQVTATGVCHTDLNWRHSKSRPGLFPAVLGHEGAGIVSKIGAHVSSVTPGDHVLVTYACCTQCRNCRSKETSFCDDWVQYNFGVGRLDGSKAFAFKESKEKITSHFFGQSTFARHAIVMESGLVKVEKELPLEILAPLGCGIQTGAGAMLNVIQPSSSSTVVIVGVGSVGMAAVMSLRLLASPPSKIIAVDIFPHRLDLAKRHGATHLIDAKAHPDLKAELSSITDGRGVDGAIDTTGRPDVLKALLNSAAKKGKVVTVGVSDPAAEVSISIFDTVNSGRTYVGCCMGNCYPQEFMPKLIAAWQEGKFPLDELIKTYNAKDMESAERDVLNGKTMKAVITWS
ncbi:MAG: kinetochore-associated Ndc80 complex subunit nuf2 [Chaenotheca gracillima]|nr:MAG: kinetochore-associated Ndc80 complex subunit nuf2 [Chaenotheca gracillima]